MTITRKQYMDKEYSHDEYYEQFVTEGVKKYVCRVIGRQHILDSKDPHFNDIPLYKWDSMCPQIKIMIDRNKLREAEGWNEPETYPWSLCCGVCIAKQAAKDIKQRR